MGASRVEKPKGRVEHLPSRRHRVASVGPTPISMCANEALPMRHDVAGPHTPLLAPGGASVLP